MLQFLLSTPWTWAFAVVLLAFGWLYFYLTNVYSYWSRQGVPGPKPTWFLGNIYERIGGTPGELERVYARKYGRVYGAYEGLSPTLTVSDSEIIRQVMIQDFPTFANRRKMKTYHEVFDQAVFTQEGDNWKRMRTIVTPSFTTGKLRGMQLLMNRCIEKLDQYLERITSNTNNRSEEFNLRPVISGFTIDVIASTSFATETNANDDRSEQNPIVVQGSRIFKLPILKIIFILSMPARIIRMFGIKTVFTLSSVEFFLSLCRRIVHDRKAHPEKNHQRRDLVQMLMEASVSEEAIKEQNYDKLEASNDKNTESQQSESSSQRTTKGKSLTLTEDEVVGNCVIFFIAGFETTAATLSYCLYELSVNPEVQEKLYNEIIENVGELDRSSSEYYDKVMHLPYLECVIKETLRKYPPLLALERRVATDKYLLNGSITLRKDQLVQVPTMAVHYDEEYYPEPEVFKPTRWLPENKHILTPYTYVPFGIGPRNCVGMRFAYQEIKLCLAHILTRYRFVRSVRTPDKLKFIMGAVLMVKEIPICVEKR